MNLFDKLGKAQGVKMLCGAAIAFEKSGTGYSFAVKTAPTERPTRPGEHVLLALHYYSQVLTRYPRSRPDTERIALDLQEMIRLVVEEGIWTDSDIISYADLDERMKMVPQVSEGAAEIRAALIRPLLSDDLDVAVEEPATITDDERVLSVFALLQGILPLLDGAGVKLFDYALRHLKSFHDEGGNYSDPAAARNMANRAFREAGGEAA